jgi:hypothetical protein
MSGSGQFSAEIVEQHKNLQRVRVKQQQQEQQQEHCVRTTDVCSRMHISANVGPGISVPGRRCVPLLPANHKPAQHTSALCSTVPLPHSNSTEEDSYLPVKHGAKVVGAATEDRH